jgi:diacylglycerol kinase family enzyme
MRVTLVHNPGAGEGGVGEGAAAIERVIRAAGHSVHVTSCAEDDWARALDLPADLIAVHGGDGTVGRVAKRMLGRGVPLAALAGGTANNIATTLGTESLPVEEHVHGWIGARRITFDACVARGPFGTRYLLEGLGIGLFTWAMRTDDAHAHTRPEEPQARVAHALAMLGEQVTAHAPTRVQATLDGNDLTGDYLVMEAMNTQFIGPNLFLAPDAHPGDGLLDVVTVTDENRAEFRDHLASWKRGALQPHAWPSRRGRHLQLRWTGFPLHLDDESWPQEGRPQEEGAQVIDVNMMPGALEFLVPPEHPHPPVR